MYTSKLFKNMFLIYLILMAIDHIHLRNLIMKDDYRRIYRSEYTTLHNQIANYVNQLPKS